MAINGDRGASILDRSLSGDDKKGSGDRTTPGNAAQDLPDDCFKNSDKGITKIFNGEEETPEIPKTNHSVEPIYQ